MAAYELKYTAEEIDGILESVDEKKIYGDATQSEHGLMSTTDKGKLDSLPTSQQIGTSLSGKVDKVDGKGLSTYDYDKTAKDKVDAIPADPKYTDTVYDDTALAGRVSTIESKESGWDAKQDAINDLDTIRSGAAAGASAIPMPSGGSVGQVLKKTTDGTEWANESGGGGSITVDNELSSSSENPVQNKAIKAALDGKVNTDPGKGLSANDFTDGLKNKLTGLINIRTTDYDAANDRITIGGKTYQLTPYVPIPDYYIGWTTGNKSAFNALSDLQIAELAGQGKYISTNPTYTRAFGTDTIFFLLYRSTTIPSKIIFTSSNQPMQQDIVADNNFGSHADVEIGGTKYKLFGIYMSGGDPTDSITIQYQ